MRTSFAEGTRRRVALPRFLVASRAAALVAALGLATDSSAQTFDTPALTPGSVVGRLELRAPASNSFVVRGTLPVPRATFPRPDGFSPFALRGPDGVLVPAQTEVVSRFPETQNGADVVEVLGRVDRGAVPAGTSLVYDVVWSPHEPEPIVLDPRVEELLREPDSIVMTTKDVFGNRYVANLLTSDVQPKSLRHGEACHEWRVHVNLEPLAPESGAQGTLPHMLGVHAYFRIWKGEPVISLDLRIHNGHSGLDTTTSSDDPLGKVYFENLVLWLPASWTAVQDEPDLYAGTSEVVAEATRYPIVRSMDGDALHVMFRQGQMVRRLALAPRGLEAKAREYARDENLGFSRRGTNAAGEPLLSWWNPASGRYFPQRHVLPRLDHVGASAIEAQLSASYSTYATALRDGTSPGYPVLAPAFGWAHPWGIDDGGMVGGDEIVMYEGLRALEAASNTGYRFLALRNRMLTDRQPVALFNRDGEPSQYTQWTVQGFSGVWLPIWCFLTPILWAGDPFGFLTAPTFQVDAVAAQGRAPAYEAEFSYYKPIDLEHLVRYTSTAKALAWIGNDTLAKDALSLHAELFRMGYNELPNSDYGHYISTGMAADWNYVNGYPGIGFTFGRLEGWGIDAVTSAYALETPEWRARVKPWFDRVTELVFKGQAQCSGFIEAMIYEQLFLGHYRARQAIEEAIVQNALVGMRETVMLNVDPERSEKLDRVLAGSFRALISYPGWSTQYNAPWNKLAVGDADFTHAPFCGTVPPDGTADGGDGWQSWSSLAYARALTGNQLYIQRAAEMTGTTMANLLQAQQNLGLWNLENRAALLAWVQNMP